MAYGKVSGTQHMEAMRKKDVKGRVPCKRVK